MSSHFENTFFPFQCETCGTRFKTVLRVLIELDAVRCPRCHGKVDIRESKRAGDISRALVTAAQQDQGSVTRN
jgi:DNA-directed RNA polymerase subunit RPC12/RpoP